MLKHACSRTSNNIFRLRCPIAGLLSLFCLVAVSPPAEAAKPAHDLIAAINTHRQQHGLPAIAASPKLNAVAVAHVNDLAAHQPQNKCGGNLHSWSSHGNWKAGCFDLNNQSTWPIMWDKPGEIAKYPSKGYEIAASGAYGPQAALNIWKGSSAHNDVILNRGMWKSYPWEAIGAAYGNGYACVWFGTSADVQPMIKLKAFPPKGVYEQRWPDRNRIQWDRLRRAP